MRLNGLDVDKKVSWWLGKLIRDGIIKMVGDMVAPISYY